MPLQRGPNSIRNNINELMKGAKSAPRKKAINTLAKKHNISQQEAMFRQAKAIAIKQARKKTSSVTKPNPKSSATPNSISLMNPIFNNS